MSLLRPGVIKQHKFIHPSIHPPTHPPTHPIHPSIHPASQPASQPADVLQVHSSHYCLLFQVRFVCMSDTHNQPIDIESLPPGDVFLHAGDFTNVGSLRDILHFNEFLGKLVESP